MVAITEPQVEQFTSAHTRPRSEDLNVLNAELRDMKLQYDNTIGAILGTYLPGDFVVDQQSATGSNQLTVNDIQLFQATVDAIIVLIDGLVLIPALGVSRMPLIQFPNVRNLEQSQ